MSKTSSALAITTRSLLLLIARLAFAALLLGRAWWRWDVQGMGAQTQRLTEFGIPLPEVVAWGTLVLEALGGAMLAIGLLTRVVGAFVAAENIIIIAALKWHQGIYSAYGGFEYNAALAALGIVFLAVGTSYAGLDPVLFRRRKEPEIDDPSYVPGHSGYAQ